MEPINQQAHSLCNGSSLLWQSPNRIMREDGTNHVRSFCVGEGPVLCFEVLGMKRMQAPKFPGTEKTQNGWNTTKPFFFYIKIRSGKFVFNLPYLFSIFSFHVANFFFLPWSWFGLESILLLWSSWLDLCLESNEKETVNEKKGKKSQMIKIQRKGRTMDFETLR